MATTSTSKSKTTSATKQSSTTREARIERGMDLIKKFAFQLYVAIAAGITIFVLALSGVGANAFTYDDTMFTVIAIYNIAIMIVPAILAFKHKQQLVPRLIIIGASIVFIWLVLPVMTRLFGVWEWAQGLWSVPFIGPFIFCWGAVIAHGFAAIVLSFYREDTLADDRNKLPELNKRLEKANEEVRSSDVAYRRIEEDKRDLYNNSQVELAHLNAQKEVSDEKSAERERLELLIKQASEEMSNAREAQSSAHKNRDKIAKKIERINGDIEAQQASDKLATRDVIFWPILWLSLAFLLYPTWYGWILVTTS